MSALKRRTGLLFSLTTLLMISAQFCSARQDDEHDVPPRQADSARSTIQQEGLRVNPPSQVAIIGATVHRNPNSEPKIETVLINGSKIVSIASGLEIPAGTRIVDLGGKHLYPGLIDAYVGHSFEPPEEKGTAYWNRNVTPQLAVATEFKLDGLDFEKSRKAGFTAALVAPDKGIVQGQSSLLLMQDHVQENSILAANIAQHLKLTVSRGGRGGGYPNSPMGAYALARQAMYDAQWYQKAWQSAATDPSVERPEKNSALDAFGLASSGKQPVIVETSNELFAIRADRFAKEFGLRLVILGSGHEYRRLDEIASLGRTIILPVNFAKAPDVSSPEMALDVSLENLMHWDHAPENAARLASKGVNFVFTSKGLKEKAEFLTNVRTAVKRGLSPKTALAAMTTGPAKLYGVDHLVGSLGKNKIANITVTDGDLFDDKTKVVATWVDGVQFNSRPESLREIAGTWKLTGRGFNGQSLVIKKTEKSLTGRIIETAKLGTRSDESDDKKKDKTEPGVAVKPIALSGTRLTGAFRSDSFGHTGISLFSLMVSTDQTAQGHLTLASGSTIPFSANLATETPDEKQPGKIAKSDTSKDESKDKSADKSNGKTEPKPASYPVNYPLGAFGVAEIPPQPKTVLVQNVNVWTLADQGNIENGAVLFGEGKIKAIFRAGDELPLADVTIDGQGAHLTPGIIDCHSHMATDSGVNESGQAITAEVRIGDMIDCDDITIYRQLAGGVTTANILHGSANPIGGQNQVIKLRWGSGEEAMKFIAAPQGIKFALGENVKQSNWDNPTDRYPQTRMGVEQIIDDALRAAMDYRSRWEDWNRNHTGLPPRRDLELDAMAEIVDGTRWIHCHSYRQDEILALLRTLESHNITIGTFQHILEGYKVADQMAAHGAMGSAFADWWAYKYEVKDAIPYAGALMHRAGVVVSFNSDDSELGRHLNHEAVKAVRYGGVSEIEALKFVTLNPARQLRIEDRVGSIEIGKDADLVLWTGHPLSNMSVAKQTWIDGRKYFDREEDVKARAKVREMRLTLIQKILESGEEMEKPTAASIDPASLWPRHDEFCGHSHDHGGEHSSHDHGVEHDQ